MNANVNALYAEYLIHTDGDKAAAASLTLAVMLQESRPSIAPVATDRPMTPCELARHLRVTTHKVLNWIHRGELTATNVATCQSKRPRYRIGPNDLARFQQQRVSLRTQPSGEQTVRHGRPRRRSSMLPAMLSADTTATLGP